jgi:hypothetical protein
LITKTIAATAGVELSCPVTTVFIVENKVNLRYVAWLQSVQITYWGDIDIEGLAILSMLRASFPHVQSFMMDQSTIDRYERLLMPGTARILVVRPYLNAAEHDLFLACRSRNIRLEQERIPQADVVAKLSESARPCSTPTPVPSAC